MANDVRDGNDDETRHGHHAGGFGIEPFADEFGHGEFAVLTQVWRKKEGEQNVAAGPAHEKHGTAVAAEGDEAGHGDEGGGTHPISGSGHTVGNGTHATAGHIKFLGGLGFAPDGNADVCDKGDANDQIRPGLDVHQASSLDSGSVSEEAAEGSSASAKPCFSSS